MQKRDLYYERIPTKLLRNDVRYLGNILGKVIKDQEGQKIFELVEKVRKLSKANKTNINNTHSYRKIIRTIKNYMVEKDGNYVPEDIWVLDTVGSNLKEILAIDYIDTERTYSNDIQEVYRTLGIEAARQCIYNELAEAFSDTTYINYHHMSMLCDRMCATKKMVSIFRHGINNDDIGPIAKASFEETPEMFLKAARHAELDLMTGVSANIVCGQDGYYGTGSFQVL